MGKSIPSYLRKSTKWQTNPTRSAASFSVRLFPLFSTFRGESRQRAGAAKVPRRVGTHRGTENGGRDAMLQQDAGRLRQSPKAAIHLPWGQKVLRALLAAGTPVFSTNLYQSWPRLFRPLIPRSACGIDVVLRASSLAPMIRNGGLAVPARFDHASRDCRGERVNRWANPTKKTAWLPRNRCPAGEQTGNSARIIKGTFWISCNLDKVPCSPSLMRRRLSARDECRS